VRCPQCASENPADYRFCGMCGTPLEKPAPVGEPVTRSASPRPEAPVTVPADEILARVEKFKPKSRSNGGASLLGLNDTAAPVDRRAKETPSPGSDRPPVDRVPVEPAPNPVEWGAHREPPSSSTISGPSFLGLGADPAPHGGHGDSSHDLTYLFDEDEQPRRSYGRFIGILLVLAIIGGLGYLQYKRSGGSWTPPWAKGPAQTPVQASQPQPGDQANVGENSSQNASNSSPAGPAPSGQTAGAQPPAADQPPNAKDRPPESSVKEQDLPPQGAQGQAGAAGSSAPGGGSQTASAEGAENSAEKSGNKEETTETASAAGPSGTKGATNAEPARPGAKTPGENNADAKDTESSAKGSGAAEKENADNAEAADVPAKAAKPARTKPSPQVASPDDTLVTNAEKYLYGRGVPQNCDRALISLRAAANRQNTRAMTLLGTMYGTGHCVSRDLPNAYRWFAQASRQTPDNMWITRNLEMIWREMTPAERQLATARQ
jgi:hypothetical protein